MKKTKKALLAAIACAAAIMGASAVAACNKGDGNTPAHTHSDGWSTWTVTQKPTETAKGKATRTCTNDGCDATDADKEYELPELDSTDYVKGADSATCAAGGKITYTYNKDGVNVSFDVATEKTTNHVWGEWTVETTNKPTENAKGKATRTCTVDGCTVAADEYELPELDSTDYVKGADSATCAAGGKITYTYNKDGVNVSFDVATEKTTNHVWGEWTVETANKPTENAKGKATRTCTADGCTVAADEYELPELDSTEYTKAADTATCAAGGKITYTYNKNGVKVSFDVATQATGNHVWGEWTLLNENMPTLTAPGKLIRTCVNSGCEHIDEYELPVLTSDKYTKTNDTASCISGGTANYAYTEDGKNVNFTADSRVDLNKHGTLTPNAKVDANCDTDGTAEYWECTKCHRKFDAAEGGKEIFDNDLVIPAKGHTYGEPVYHAAEGENKENVTYTCSVCGHDNVMECAGEFAGSASGSSNPKFELGKVYHFTITNSTTAEADRPLMIQNIKLDQGVTEFNFKYLDSAKFAMPLTGRYSSIAGKKFMKDATTVADAYKDYVTAEFTDGNLTKLTIKAGNALIAKGSNLIIVLTTPLAVGASSNVAVWSTYKPQIFEGENNKISITEANASADTSADKYEFVSATDKDYSITVPEGVTVLLNGEDLITSGTSANFTAKAGEPLVFTFIGDMGDYAATIGEPVIKPVLNVSTADKNNTYGVNITGKTVSVVEIGDVEAGKTYNIDVSGAFLSGRMMGQGCAQFKFNNGSDDFNAMFDANAQQLYYGSGENETNGCKITRTSQSITLTFTATSEKTYLYFSCSNKNVTGDLGVLTLKMTEAVEG